MRIHTKLNYIWEKDGYRLVSEEGFYFPDNGIALCKGATQQQNDLASSQTNFYNTLQQDQAAQFSNQQNVLSTLQNTLNPIVQAGPNQYGFNAAETNNLNSNVINNTATQYANAARNLGAQQGAAGGGNSLLPSGVASQQQARLAASAADQTATGLTDVQQKGYQQGTANYNNAIGQLGGVSGQYGSGAQSFAGSANNAGSNAGSTLETIQKENAAASPWNIVGGVLGGALNAGLDFATGGLSGLAGGIPGIGSTSAGSTGGADFGPGVPSGYNGPGMGAFGNQFGGLGG